MLRCPGCSCDVQAKDLGRLTRPEISVSDNIVVVVELQVTLSDMADSGYH